jgi:hypothetical protein
MSIKLTLDFDINLLATTGIFQPLNYQPEFFINFPWHFCTLVTLAMPCHLVDVLSNEDPDDLQMQN